MEIKLKQQKFLVLKKYITIKNCEAQNTQKIK